MTNRLILRERRGYPWGKVSARIFWVGGGRSSVWVNDSGVGEFKGSGVIDHIDVAGETLYPATAKVDGNTDIMAKSNKSH